MRSKLPQRWSQSVKLYVQKHQRCEKVNSKSPSFCHSDARSQPFRVALQPAVMSTSDIFTQSQGWPFSSIQDFHDVHPKRSSKTPFESVQVCTRQCWTPVLGWAPCSRKAEAIDPGEQSHDVTAIWLRFHFSWSLWCFAPCTWPSGTAPMNCLSGWNLGQIALTRQCQACH